MLVILIRSLQVVPPIPLSKLLSNPPSLLLLSNPLSLLLSNPLSLLSSNPPSLLLSNPLLLSSKSNKPPCCQHVKISLISLSKPAKICITPIELLAQIQQEHRH